MLSNTGTVSLVLYGAFIVITLVGMIVAFRLMKKGSIEEGKLSKMIDLFKYAIVTVGIGTVAFIVTDLFKEREQDLKELEYFNTYVQDVKKADGIEERLRLVKYLSIVSPSGEIKKSWQEYYKEVLKEYEEYLDLKAEQNAGDSMKGLTVDERKKAIDNQVKLNAFEKPLGGSTESPAKPTIYIQCCDKSNMLPMMKIRDMFRSNSWIAPDIELVKDGCDNSIRYFHDEDRNLAIQANALLGNSYVIKKVKLMAPKGQIELWAGD
jgi:hypothetical protein